MMRWRKLYELEPLICIFTYYNHRESYLIIWIGSINSYLYHYKHRESYPPCVRLYISCGHNTRNTHVYVSPEVSFFILKNWIKFEAGYTESYFKVWWFLCHNCFMPRCMYITATFFFFWKYITSNFNLVSSMQIADAFKDCMLILFNFIIY